MCLKMERKDPLKPPCAQSFHVFHDSIIISVSKLKKKKCFTDKVKSAIYASFVTSWLIDSCPARLWNKNKVLYFPSAPMSPFLASFNKMTSVCLSMKPVLGFIVPARHDNLASKMYGPWQVLASSQNKSWTRPNPINKVVNGWFTI